MSNVGFRVYHNIKRPPKELVMAFKGLPTPNIADNMNRFFCMDASIKPLNDVPLLGTAVTVRSSTADNLLFHKALDVAQEGDVIVVDVQGDTINSVVGEIMMRYAMKRGIAGFLVDGAVRDSGSIKKFKNFSVYAKGITPKGPYKDGPGEINVPVCCGGVTVNPGDIIVGDDDGVVVVRPEDAPSVLEKAKAMFLNEQKKMKSIEDGTMDKSWVDKALKAKGCEYIY